MNCATKGKTVNAPKALFPSIEITPEEGARLRALKEKEIGLAQFIEQVVAAGEKRGQALMAEGQAVWNDLAKTYKLDVAHVQYVPSDDFTKLVPKAVRL